MLFGLSKDLRLKLITYCGLVMETEFIIYVKLDINKISTVGITSCRSDVSLTLA